MNFKKLLIYNFLFLALALGLANQSVQARDQFRFELGDEIHVISDKAFRITLENVFEAIGNVIIKFGNNSIYSEKANINFNTGEIKVEGNVRYIAPAITMYGTKLYYNTKTQKVQIFNARVVSDNFVILGKELTKHSEERLTGKDAEYTTCKDCPESWSVFGKDIDVTIGEYVRIKHGYIKTKGVVLMYIPYIIFPIKKARETGILFPSTSFNFADGVKFQLPFFWAISDSSDMTITPSLWGRRGLGGDLEYRHYFTDRDWFEVRSLLADDKVYEPHKAGFELSGDTKFRHYTNYEHHFSSGLFFNHHLTVDLVKDLDMLRDFDFYAQRRNQGSELGAEGFFDFRLPQFNFSVESEFKRNLLVSRALSFDDSYVQILPKFSFSSTPFTLINSDIFGLNSISAGVDADYTVFRQNKVSENTFIRNAHRLNLFPYLNWNLGNLGGVNFNNYTTFDYQSYNLNNEPTEQNFYKHAFIHRTSATIEIEKIFGVAYRELVPEERVKQEEKEEKPLETYGFVGHLPDFEVQNKSKKIEIYKNSYRHSQIFQLNHYLLSGIGSGGNDRFRSQLEDEDGQFDVFDAFRERDFQTSEVDNQTTLPLRNTIELQWRNSIIEKSARKFDFNVDHRYLKQNFDYRRIAYFNISQGYNLDVESDTIRDKLTRLYVNTGFTLDEFSLSADEYYFYKDQKHFFRVSLARSVPFGGISTSFIYDSVTEPVKKLFQLSGHIRLMDLTRVYASFGYDLEAQRNTPSLYGIEYTPLNDCWKIDVNYSKNDIDNRLSFNFAIKFNDKNFASFSEM